MSTGLAFNIILPVAIESSDVDTSILITGSEPHGCGREKGQTCEACFPQDASLAHKERSIAHVAKLGKSAGRRVRRGRSEGKFFRRCRPLHLRLVADEFAGEILIHVPDPHALLSARPTNAERDNRGRGRSSAAKQS